jgi:Uma2 family endonuclease
MANRTRRWTLDELHRLPDDDGNKYELVRGQLFVTPAPTDAHETIGARLTRLLDPYVAANGLGLVYRPRAVVVIEDDTEVEPDLMVRQPQDKPGATWKGAPIPILIVEIESPTTYRRDRVFKRNVYLDAGIPEYWIVDGEERTIRVVRPGHDDITATDSVTWQPDGVATRLVIALADVFGPRPAR